MNKDLLEYLSAFQSKLETLFSNELYADELLKAVADGRLSLISTNSEISIDDYESLVNEIESRMKSLHEINKNPRRFLKSEELIRPVELSKNVNNRTLYELSKNSHNWKRKRIASVEPTHLLTEVNEDDLKLYENKVYKSLLDRSFQTLHIFHQELQKMINDKRNAVRINKNFESGYKGAKLFKKIAPNNIDDLNKIDEEHLQLSILIVEDAKKRVQLLQKGNLYYNLRKEYPVKSPLNKTNILMKDKNYFNVWELWKKIDEEEFRRGEIAQENNALTINPEQIYFTYVFINLVIILLNDGFQAVDNNLGDYKLNNLRFTAKDQYTQVTFKTDKSAITGSILEIGSINLEIINEHQLEFFREYSFNDEINYDNNALFVERKVKESTIQKLKDDFARFLSDKYKKDFEKKGAERVKQRVFKEKLDMEKNVLNVIKNFKNESQTIPFSINVISKELPGTNMELEETIENLRNQYNKINELIVYPGIDSVDGIKLSERVTYLLNTLGENIGIALGSETVEIFGNYKFQMFELSPNNLSSINRISRFFNILKYKFSSYRTSLNEYCPSCGENAVHKKNETDYTCYKCGSIWSYSKCKKCNHDYLYLRLEDEQYIDRQEFGDLHNYLDYLEIYRGTLALTNIDIVNEFKTLCPKCGRS